MTQFKWFMFGYILAMVKCCVMAWLAIRWGRDNIGPKF
jgi:hypothetical protein